jgi:hypothetical protein
LPNLRILTRESELQPTRWAKHKTTNLAIAAGQV